jgi:hypothetical protein
MQSLCIVRRGLRDSHRRIIALCLTYGCETSSRDNARHLERDAPLYVDLMSHRDARHRTGQRDRLPCAHSNQQRGNMKDRKKVPEDSKETQELEQRPDVEGEDDTKRLRTLTVQELERLLKEKKPG